MATILIADDTRLIRAKLSQTLRAHGHTVHEAENGREALVRALTGTPPDLILLDLYMPEVDGFTVLENLRQDIQAARIPVIIISTSTKHEDVLRVRQLGATDYMVKPVDPVKLVLRITDLLAKRDAVSGPPPA